MQGKFLPGQEIFFIVLGATRAPLRLPPPKREGREESSSWMKKEEEAWILRFAQDKVFLLLFVHKKKTFAFLLLGWRLRLAAAR